MKLHCFLVMILLVGCASTEPKKPFDDISALKPFAPINVDKNSKGRDDHEVLISTASIRFFQCSTLADSLALAVKLSMPKTAKFYVDQLTKCKIYSGKEMQQMFTSLHGLQSDDQLKTGLMNFYSAWSVQMNGLNGYTNVNREAHNNYEQAKSTYQTLLSLKS